MSTSVDSHHHPTAVRVEIRESELVVELNDARTLIVPLAWYPRLEHATHEERAGWVLIGEGRGIHWDAIDEDVSIDALIAGRASRESLASLQRWLAARRAR